MGIVVRFPEPERVLVDLDSFPFRAAEDHGTQPAISDGIRLAPLPSRFVVPERQRAGIGHGSGANPIMGERQGQCDTSKGGGRHA